MNPKMIQTKKSGISPIIATLLLILIAIAAGVIVYAYVIGFIGNSTTNSGNSTSIVSIDNSCVSKAGSGCGIATTGFTIVIRNVGSTTISGACSVYLTDVTQGITLTGTAMTCNPSGVAPGSTYTASGTTPWTSTAPNAVDTITIKIVMSDGGSSTTSVKAIG